jgi:6-phosphogluconate dehydrogenase
MNEPVADIGLIGLAVMGQNLVLNMNDHGYVVAVYNRTVSKVDEFLAGPAQGTNVIGAHTIQELISVLKRPRRIMLMVKAGEPVDEFINLLVPHLEEGDIIIDGGNSNYQTLGVPGVQWAVVRGHRHIRWGRGRAAWAIHHAWWIA